MPEATAMHDVRVPVKRRSTAQQEARLTEVQKSKEQVDGCYAAEAQAGWPGETDTPVAAGRRHLSGP
jgi:hypothetical protein